MNKPMLFIALFALAGTVLSQSPITRIPFEFYGDHMIIKVSVDDSRPLEFIFDTGAGLTVMDEDIVTELGLSINKKVQMEDMSDQWAIIKHNTIEVDGFLMEKNTIVYATDLDHLEISLGRNLDGIIGYDLLKHHGIYVNYDAQTLEIYHPGEAPANGEGIPFELYQSIPVIEGTIVLNNGESQEGNFLLVSGAGTTLDFNTPYADKKDIVNKTGKHYSYYTKGVTEKEYLHYEGHILSLSFGNQKIEDLPIGISTSASGLQGDKAVSGIIGSQLLRLYNYSLDYQSKMWYIEKDRTYEPVFNVNCSGVDLQLSKDKQNLLIHQVIENSPAAIAGIRKDDVLLEVNGVSVDEMNLPDIQKMLKKEGESVTLQILQDGEKQDFELKLRSLIK